MTFTRRKLLALLATMVGFAILLVAFFPRQRPQPEPLPNPNGYDDFVKAASVRTPVPDDVNLLSDSELQNYVEQNAEALALVRSGLTKESKVPIKSTQDFYERHVSELASTKATAQMMQAIAQCRLRQGRTNDAARIYAELIHFGHHSLREGLLINFLVTVAIEMLGSMPLAALIPSLDAPTSRHLITTLSAIDAQQEPFEQIAARDRKWAKASLRARDYGTLVWLMIRHPSFDTSKDAVDKGRQRHQQARHQRYQLIAQLAARAFELEHGRAPKNWSDLSPAYVKTVPAEFRSGTNAVYEFQAVFAPPGS